MLKALELSGFKSFADRTRFEFPPGITVVVGPNGSGKSNIVDALKWVLGEQSAKSLRGKDMSDVIFKGSSGPGSRKPAGSAAVTLFLENPDGRLMNDSPEVSVTRRVYRSGESEYLINGTPCRLKDIRDLFRGTGIGTDAYSLIEQGKVERMLSASARDRRAIFEEAAGISRFKARKIEAERRLERVQGNLVRLADIVEEVGSRYRAVKNQASRAARYRELSTRLQELRVEVGSRDYRLLAERITEAEQAALRQAAELEQHEQLLADSQLQTSRLENQLEELTAGINLQQEAVAAVRDETVQLESRLESEQRRRADLAERIGSLRAQLAGHEEKANRLRLQQQAVESEWTVADSEYRELAAHLEGLQQALEKHERDSASLTAEVERLGTAHASASASELESGRELAAFSAQLDSVRNEQKRADESLRSLQQELGRTESELDAKRKTWQQDAREAEQNDSALKSARESTDSLEELIATRQHSLSEQKSALAGVVQRAKVIAELEKKLEHANSGSLELLRIGKQDSSTGVVGLVADLLQVNVRHATLIDAALGPVAQYVVVRDDTLVQRIAMGEFRIPGRVGILSLRDAGSGGTQTVADPGDDPEVIGPALSLVEQVGAGFEPLVQALLGNTWIVRTLASALALRARGFAQHRFVTLDGELLDRDGTLMAGARTAAQGIVSRRSELRSLADQQTSLTGETQAAEQTLVGLRKELAQGKRELQQLLADNQRFATRLSGSSAAVEQLERQRERLVEQQAGLARELAEADARAGKLATSLEQGSNRHQRLKTELASLVASLSEKRQSLESLQSGLAETNREWTMAKVRMARAEQQRLDLAKRRDDLALQLLEAEHESGQMTGRIAADELSLQASLAETQTTGLRLEELGASREAAATRLQELVEQRTGLDSQRKSHASALNRARTAAREAQQLLGESRLRINQYQLERNQLAERLLEDYQIDIAAQLAAESADPPGDRARIDEEISDLRQKIGALGSVNLQALAELEELETRYQHLDGQYQDLVSARDSLLRIIHRINNDSRKLFVETVEAIRQNFQKLFRQTFGGGQADIVMEEGVDVLEAGVEIIATPPGKPKFNNSLLSGGEKALTAVSLLMAIFQFRPSPFCVLDEVDAPFDEANIGRFIDVLRSFLGWTRFVIVTHSKKTMTAATTLYGVTMQESGVSKRVSVRFEDVSEDGQISRSAVERSQVLPDLADRNDDEEDEEHDQDDLNESGDGGQRTVA